MTHRRLILAACVTVVALGAAWWLLSDGLSAEERRLVGTWRLNSAQAKGECTVEFKADRSCGWKCYSGPGRHGESSVVRARWFFQGGRLALDYEPNPVRRGLRPFRARVGVDAAPVQTITPEFVSADKFVLGGAGDYRQVWTRDRGD